MVKQKKNWKQKINRIEMNIAFKKKSQQNIKTKTNKKTLQLLPQHTTTAIKEKTMRGKRNSFHTRSQSNERKNMDNGEE